MKVVKILLLLGLKVPVGQNGSFSLQKVFIERICEQTMAPLGMKRLLLAIQQCCPKTL